jgi:hypothetical protein
MAFHQAELRANWELARGQRSLLPIFEPLRDPAYFARAYVDPDSRTVTWPNGANFAPDFLYELAAEEAPVAQLA